MRIILATLLCVTTTAAFASPVGEWVVRDKSARVVIRPCGTKLCGNLGWSADGKDIGQPVLIDMKADGARWTGTVVDVRDGTRYAAHIALTSEQVLRLDECVLGGVICSGEIWTRFK